MTGTSNTTDPEAMREWRRLAYGDFSIEACTACGATLQEPCNRESGHPCGSPNRPHHPGQWINLDHEGDDDR